MPPKQQRLQPRKPPLPRPSHRRRRPRQRPLQRRLHRRNCAGEGSCCSPQSTTKVPGRCWHCCRQGFEGGGGREEEGGEGKWRRSSEVHHVQREVSDHGRRFSQHTRVRGVVVLDPVGRALRRRFRTCSRALKNGKITAAQIDDVFCLSDVMHGCSIRLSLTNCKMQCEGTPCGSECDSNCNFVCLDWANRLAVAKAHGWIGHQAK
mmetsp:Transcript_10194/g.26624  ORF Transcript_10194/g.26624 Transcript_10194/m.26624 type:complete len:206 (-) Transcript_10194:74-691(-)